MDPGQGKARQGKAVHWALIIEEYLCKATVSIQTVKEDFFGDPVDRSDDLSGGYLQFV